MIEEIGNVTDDDSQWEIIGTREHIEGVGEIRGWEGFIVLPYLPNTNKPWKVRVVKEGREFSGMVIFTSENPLPPWGEEWCCEFQGTGPLTVTPYEVPA